MDRIVVIDNYDSFTYNLVHALNNLSGTKVEVLRNDKLNVAALEQFQGFVLSPGPGIPAEAGMLKEVIERYAPTRKMLGVCLGHQAMAEVFGGRLININKVYHGVATRVKILAKDDPLYHGIPDNFEAGRYHSWIVSRDQLPSCFIVTAEAENGEVMSISHKQYELTGVQYHPESVLTGVGEDILRNWLNQKS